MKRDIFLRLPQPMAMLLLSAILNLTSAHAVYPLPRQTSSSPQPRTTTLPHHVIDTVPFPPRPTAPPRLSADLLRRQDLNTICGFIGGDPNLPATCGVGSHCVLDIFHGAVGCCPNNEPTCTTGVFTGCVDGNSSPQTEVNPYVYTCQGGNVCYKNVFEGGFFQFGCGTASDLATSVLATATGITETPSRPSLTFSFTENANPLTAPTTLGTVTVPNSTDGPTSTEIPMTPTATTESPSTAEPTGQTSNTERSSTEASGTEASGTEASGTEASGTVASGTVASSTETSSSVSSTATESSSNISSASASSTSSNSNSISTSSSISSSSTSQTSSETSTLTSPTSNLMTSSATSTPIPNDPQSRDHTGAIVGGTISGVAVLVAAIALGIFLWRRKKRHANQLGPHSTGGPTAYVSPMSGAPYYEGGFAPVHQDQDGWETGMPPSKMAAAGGARIYPVQQEHEFGYPPARTGYDYPSQYPAGYGVGAGSSAGGATSRFGGIPPPRPARAFDEAEAEAEPGDQVPLTREIDDFSRGFHDALGRIGEEDEYESSRNNSGTGVNEGNGVSGPISTAHNSGSDNTATRPYGGVRPLWQQQRRQSRNLMWM